MPAQTNSAALNHVILNWIPFSKTAAANTATAISPASIAITGISISGYAVTLTVAAHQFTLDTFVKITGSPNGVIDGVWPITSITNANSIIITWPAYKGTVPNMTGWSWASSAVSFSTIAQVALITANSTNTQAVGIGPSNAANHYSLKAGEQYEIRNPTGFNFDLSHWYFKPAVSSEGISVIFV